MIIQVLAWVLVLAGFYQLGKWVGWIISWGLMHFTFTRNLIERVIFKYKLYAFNRAVVRRNKQLSAKNEVITSINNESKDLD